MTGCLDANSCILEARIHLRDDQIALLSRWPPFRYLAMGCYLQEELEYLESLLATQPLRCESCRERVVPECSAASLPEV